MIKLDGMLMIGAGGSNVGKTDLACALIKKFGKTNGIVGIKVTTISAKDGKCPRGGRGCGVCSSLEGDFCITEETVSQGGKDTSRLLAAGAKKVYWLRVLKKSLLEGIETLLDIIGPDAVSICESNSLRNVVAPALFLMVRRRGLRILKESARRVAEYADKIVTSQADGFDFDLDDIKLVNRRWSMPVEATAIIMAGGRSCRMGLDKGMLPIKGRPIVEHICRQLDNSFSQILISANETDKYGSLGFEVVPDRIAGQGPLMGIASAMEASVNELNFVVACDIPHINLACVRKMLTEAENADIVIPFTGRGKYEPLFAVYRKSLLETINDVLASGARKISEVFSRCRVKYIELVMAQWFVNLNTMAEYEEYRKKYDA